MTADDLPGGHQFTSDNKDEGPKTIADKHEEQMVQEMDTVKLRVNVCFEGVNWVNNSGDGHYLNFI